MKICYVPANLDKQDTWARTQKCNGCAPFSASHRTNMTNHSTFLMGHRVAVHMISTNAREHSISVEKKEGLHPYGTSQTQLSILIAITLTSISSSIHTSFLIPRSPNNFWDAT